MSISLTVAATAAAQLLGVLDTGETLSTTQLNDSFGFANRLLANWTQEQILSIQILVNEQTRSGQAFVDLQARSGVVMVDDQYRNTGPLVVAFTLAGGSFTVGSYTAPSYTAGSYTPGTIPQFADNTTPITLPAGYERALVMNLPVEMAAYWGMQVPEWLLKQAAEARASASPVPRRTPIPGTSGTQTVPPVPDTPAQPNTPQSLGG